MEIIQNIWQSLRLVTLADILDIAIVAVLVYRLIKFLRGTSAAKLLKGLLLLLVVTQLSDWFELHVIYYMLSNMMQIGIIALVIIFQPELRKLLERFGRSSFKLFKQPQQEVNQSMQLTIIQTIEAVSSLSWSKTGALIVFEKEDVLTGIINTGTIVNADVNAELLKNIFYNKAPLHDGAVIISNARIMAAGCILPLSGNHNISKELGTRHRAAVGMSENYDALCVVVSEETGSISLAAGGMLKRHLAPETLERLLINELMPQTEEKSVKGLKEWFKGKIK